MSRPSGEMAAHDDDHAAAFWASVRQDPRYAAIEGAASSDEHAVLLARARRAKLAQWTAFLVGLALGAAAGVVVAWVWR